MPEGSYTTLLFDLDGTLANSDPVHLRAFQVCNDDSLMEWTLYRHAGSLPRRVCPLEPIVLRGIRVASDPAFVNFCHTDGVCAIQDLLAAGDLSWEISTLGEDSFPSSIDEAFFKANCAGRTSSMILQGAFGVTEPELIAALAAKKEARFLELVQTDLMPVRGLVPLLRHASTHSWKMGLVTNAPRPTVELMVAALGVEEWLPPSMWVLGVECDNPKPHPEPYLKGLSLCENADPSTALVFEDSPSGVKAGVAAGIRTVGVLTSQLEQTLLEVGASFGVPDFAAPLLWQVLGTAPPADLLNADTHIPSGSIAEPRVAPEPALVSNLGPEPEPVAESEQEPREVAPVDVGTASENAAPPPVVLSRRVPAARPMFNFSAAATARRGTSHRAGSGRQGIDCPCCVDTGPDASMMM